VYDYPVNDDYKYKPDKSLSEIITCLGNLLRDGDDLVANKGYMTLIHDNFPELDKVHYHYG